MPEVDSPQAEGDILTHLLPSHPPAPTPPAPPLHRIRHLCTLSHTDQGKPSLLYLPILEVLGDTRSCYSIKNLRRYPTDFIDSDGDPLFSDHSRPSYISDLYQDSDLDKLHEYRLQCLKLIGVLNCWKRTLNWRMNLALCRRQ